MRKTIVDMKLLAAGIGLGGLICAALVSGHASHVSGMVATAGALAGLALRFAEARTC